MSEAVPRQVYDIGASCSSGAMFVAEAVDTDGPRRFVYHVFDGADYRVLDIRDLAAAAGAAVPNQLTSPYFSDAKWTKLKAAADFFRRHRAILCAATQTNNPTLAPAQAAPPRYWWTENDA